MGMIPKTTKESIKLIGNFSMERIFGAVVVIIFCTSIGSLIVADKLVIPFTAYLLILYMILTSKTKNPKKIYVVSMLDSFKYLLSNKEYRASDKDNNNKEVIVDDTQVEEQLDELNHYGEEAEDTEEYDE